MIVNHHEITFLGLRRRKTTTNLSIMCVEVIGHKRKNQQNKKLTTISFKSVCFYYSCTSQNSIKTSSIFQMLHITWHNKKGGLNTLQYSVKFYVKIIIKNSLTAFSKVTISNFLFTDFEWMLTLFKVMQKHKCAISYKKGITFLQQLIILDRYISNGFNSRVLSL